MDEQGGPLCDQHLSLPICHQAEQQGFQQEGFKLDKQRPTKLELIFSGVFVG
jgi:hypothetical protein